MKKNHKKIQTILSKTYPEYMAGGYTSVDGTLEFYSRVNALLEPQMKVLDFGAGRGAWFTETENTYLKSIRLLKGRVASVTACDIDQAVHSNCTADRTIATMPQAPLPFEDEEFDLIIADYVFEHIADPEYIQSELSRILKKNGWICARTPNCYGYISCLTRLINNKHHSKILNFVQPTRQERDVFPTRFKMNTLKALRRLFSQTNFRQCIYRYESEPRYFFANAFVFHIMRYMNKFVPYCMLSTLMIFVQKI